MKDGLRFLFAFGEYVTKEGKHLAPDLEAAQAHMLALQQVALSANNLLGALAETSLTPLQARAFEDLRQKLDLVR